MLEEETSAAARRRRLVAHRWREAATTTGMIERRRMNAPLTVASFGMELPAGHPGRNPLFNLSLQPTVVSWRLEGNCPRHSRRQSVVRDSPVRAQTSRHRRRRAGERPACAGCLPVFVASSRTRALLTPLMLRGAESGSQLLLIAPTDSLGWYPDRGDPLIFRQWVGTNYESTQEVAGRFRRVSVSREIRELRVALTHRQAPAGTRVVTGWRLTDAQSRTVTY